MPTNVDLFNMLRETELSTLSVTQLNHEIDRVQEMLQAVYNYEVAVAKELSERGQK